MAAKRRPAPPPPPPPPQPPSSASTGDDEGSSSGDEEQEQARYLFQKKTSAVSQSEITKSSAAAADDASSDGEQDDDDSEEEGEEGEEEEVKEKPKEQREEEGEGSSEEEEEEEDEDEDEDEDEANKQTKNSQPPPQTSQKAPPPPESSSETGSGSSESGDEAPLPTTLPTASRPSRTKDLSIKPISSRPMDGSTAKPIASPPPHAETPLKGNGETQKRSEVGSASVGQKKQLFQRLWSIQDELAILRGMVQYQDKHGILPMHSQDMPRFLDLIKGSLAVEVSKTQLGDKVRRLKKKFMTAAARNNGADPTFSNPHNKAAYELSKKIWGSEVPTPPLAKLTEAEAELSEESESDGSARDVNAGDAKGGLTFPYLSGIIMKMDEGTPSGFGMKRSFDLVDPGKAALLEKKVKKLKLKGMRQQLKVMDLVKESMKFAVDFISTSE